MADSTTVAAGDVVLSKRLEDKLADLDAILRLVDFTLKSQEASVFENKTKRLVGIALRYTEKCEQFRSKLHGSHRNSE